MTGDLEAAGDALTGGIVASTVERESNAGGKGLHDPAHGPCPNCGATLNGPYCAQCGQAAHLHRTLSSLGHDILHGVFHFEGKIWRTLPELFLHPGRLTRRFIDGERAKFVSPMALFLFAVFLMFAVFSYTGGALLDGEHQTGNSSWQQEMGINGTDGVKIKAADGSLVNPRMKVNLGYAPLDLFLQKGLTKATDNPTLLLYKLKSNGYKYSWALIPLSVPFLWLLFFWRRDIHLYDHAIFATYSISFMMLLVVVMTLLGTAGVSGGPISLALLILPPIHMYKQLRGTYALSRFGAAVRLFFLLNFSAVVLILFALALILLGVLE